MNYRYCSVQEVEQMKRSNSAKEDEMQRRHALEKKRLPKIQKSEAKTRAQMFKQSLRLSTVGSPEDDRVKMKQVRTKSEYSNLSQYLPPSLFNEPPQFLICFLEWKRVVLVESQF